MKQFSKIILASGLVLSGLTAKANVDFELIIDNPDYVKVSVNWSEIDVNQGSNMISLEDYSSFSIDTRDYMTHILREVLVDGVNQLSGSGFYYNQYNIDELNGTTVEVHSCLIDDLRTGSFTITTDNPKRLNYVSTNGSPSTNVKLNELEAGVPYTVNYIPDVNTTIQFYASGAPIYRMIKNGEVQTPDQYGNYVLDIENGMEVEVLCNYPEVMANLTFNYQQDAADMFNRLYIYGDASTNYSKTEVEVVDNQAQVPLGSQIVIEHKPDYPNYIVDNYSVGSTVYTSVYQNIQTYITNENVEINIDAHLSDPLNVVFDISGADGLVINRKESTDILHLEDGINNMTLYSSNLDLTVKCHPSFEISSLTLNGVEQEKTWDGNYRFYSYEDMIHDGDEIKIVASPKDTFKAYITVEDASLVVLKRNYNSWSEEIIPLQNGRNELICSEGNDEFFIDRSETGYISSVNLNFDEEVYKEYSGGFRFTAQEDYEIMVTAEPIVNEGDMILYIDDINYKDLSSFSWYNDLIRDNDRSLVSGYNTLEFFHGFNPYKISAYYVYNTPVTFALYKNNEKIEVYNPSYPSADLTLAPGDVVKVFLADGEPGFYEVTFTESVPGAAFADVTYDVICNVEDVTESLNVLKGTVVEFSVEDNDVQTAVLVNNEALAPAENGLYQVEVTEDTVIELVDATVVSVDMISENTQEEYYTIDGLRLNNRPTASGIYIRVKNNKAGKVVIR